MKKKIGNREVIIEYRSLAENPTRFVKKVCDKEVHAHEKKFHHLKEGGMWMQGAVKKPGALHEALGVPRDKKIPHSKLEKAIHSSSPLMRKRANLALTFSKYRHNP